MEPHLQAAQAVHDGWSMLAVVLVSLFGLLTVVFGGYIAILKIREQNNVAALTLRVAALEKKSESDDTVIRNLLNQNRLLRAEITSMARILGRYEQAGRESLIIVNEKGVIVDWDAAATLMFGFTSDEAVGVDVSQLIVPPDLRQKHRFALNATYLNRRVPRAEPIRQRALTKSGDMINCEIRLLPGWESGELGGGWLYGARIKRIVETDVEIPIVQQVSPKPAT